MQQEHPIRVAGGALGLERHICALFNNRDEEHRVLRSFITEGLDRGEKAIHVVGPEQRHHHVERLREGGIDVEQAIAQGQLDVLAWTDAAGGTSGHRRTRLLGHMEWSLLDKPGVEDLLEYETRLNYLLPKYEDPVICSYDLSRFGADLAIDIMRTHPVVIVGGILQENPFFVPPDQFLLELRERGVVAQGTRRPH